MKNIFWLVIISFLFSCEQYDEINVEEILGEYYQLDNEKHASNLELRDDNTYHFIHGINFSCSRGQYYGKWEVLNNTLTLFEGVKFDSLISVKRKGNIKSDSIKIIFENNLLETFPQLRIRLDWDREDQQIIQQHITFNKDSLFFRHRPHEVLDKDEDRDSEYKNHRDGLILTADNFYEIVYFRLDLERMKIGLENFKTSQSAPKILLEYKLKDGMLISKGKDGWIYDHRIIKRDNSKIF